MCRVTDSLIRRLSSISRHDLRRWVGRGLLIFSAVLLVAIVFPGQYYLGPLLISLRSTRNPLWEVVVCTLLWHGLSDEAYPRYRHIVLSTIGLVRRISWYHRVLLALAVVQIALLAATWLHYPAHVISVQRLETLEATQPTNQYDEEHERENFDYFAAQCRRELPSDARILYHGHIEGMVFAYEVFPRRVFMLPGEYCDIARSWHKQRWLEGMPDDPLEPVWHQGLPTERPDRETFIREHGLTHEVWFDENEPVACRWRRLP